MNKEDYVFHAWIGFVERAACYCNIVGLKPSLRPPLSSHETSPISFLKKPDELVATIEPHAFSPLPDSAIYSLFLKGFADNAARLALLPSSPHGDELLVESCRFMERIQYGLAASGVKPGTFPWLTSC